MCVCVCVCEREREREREGERERGRARETQIETKRRESRGRTWAIRAGSRGESDHRHQHDPVFESVLLLIIKGIIRPPGIHFGGDV